MSTNKTYDIITDRLIAKIESGAVPWQKPWKTAQNLVSKKPYRGINAFMLGTSEHTSPYWITFKQALELGGCVRKGEKAEMVVYFTILGKKDQKGQPILDDNGRIKGIPFLKYSNVFNLDQIDNVEAPETPTGKLIHARAEQIVSDVLSSGRLCEVHNGGTKAAYSPGLDVIKMPSKSLFHNDESYYHTFFHEMTHATGHKDRLNRKGIIEFDAFGTEQYSKEELIAELGASFVSNEAGILSEVNFEQSASYLDSWISALKRDTKLIVSASSAAQRAADYILGVQLS